jgi:hypothetical protein
MTITTMTHDKAQKGISAVTVNCLLCESRHSADRCEFQQLTVNWLSLGLAITRLLQKMFFTMFSAAAACVEQIVQQCETFESDSRRRNASLPLYVVAIAKSRDSTHRLMTVATPTINRILFQSKLL